VTAEAALIGGVGFVVSAALPGHPVPACGRQGVSL
jgi:hypothetical protein